jgi:hypothetical protein
MKCAVKTDDGTKVFDVACGFMGYSCSCFIAQKRVGKEYPWQKKRVL